MTPKRATEIQVPIGLDKVKEAYADALEFFQGVAQLVLEGEDGREVNCLAWEMLEVWAKHQTELGHQALNHRRETSKNLVQ